MRRLILLLAVALMLGGCRSSRQIITEQTHTTDSTTAQAHTEATTSATTDSTKSESTSAAVLEIDFASPGTDTSATPTVNEVQLPDGTHIKGNIASVRVAGTRTDRAEASRTQEATAASTDHNETAASTEDTDREEKTRTPPAVKKIVLWPSFVATGVIVAAMGYLQYRLKRRKRMK